MVKEGWKEEKLGNVIELKYGKGLPKRARKKGKFPVYGSGGIVDNHNKSMIKGPGIIVGRKGNVGSVYYSKEDFFPIDTVFYIENNPNKCNLKFIYYLLKNSTSIKLSSDAAVPGLNRNYALSREFTIPEDIDEQQKIALILSNYDDLIENNTKRIQLLEEIAKLIYDEWFVKFKFPGHENVKMVDSLLGRIPEGWEVRKLGDKINVFRGKTITKKTIKPGKIPVVAGGLNPAYYHNQSNAKSPVITISASGANAGFIRLYFEDIWASDCSYISEESACFIYYYYSLMKNQQIETTALQRGSAQPHVYAKDLMRLEIIDPDGKLIIKFENIVKSIFREIACLTLKNQNLRKTRDLLLPKLISGQVDVSDLDINILEVEA